MLFIKSYTIILTNCYIFLNIGENEFDLILMFIELIGSKDDGSKKTIRVELELNGEPKMSAMAKTTGGTLAIGARILLENESSFEPGIHLPMSKKVYEKMLEMLKEEGIEANVIEF